MPTADSGTLGNLLEFIKSTRGFDFTGYKRSSIERRVVKRMSEVGVERYKDYIDYLELHAGEFGELFNALLINVTGFFRDPRHGSISPTRSSRSWLTSTAPICRCESGAQAALRARSLTPSR